MTQPPLQQQLPIRAPSGRLFERAECNLKIQLGQMAAIQMSDQIRSAEKQSIPDFLHERGLRVAADAFKPLGRRRIQSARQVPVALAPPWRHPARANAVKRESARP
jgi:hypothetical protein